MKWTWGVWRECKGSLSSAFLLPLLSPPRYHRCPFFVSLTLTLTLTILILSSYFSLSPVYFFLIFPVLLFFKTANVGISRKILCRKFDCISTHPFHPCVGQSFPGMWHNDTQCWDHKIKLVPDEKTQMKYNARHRVSLHFKTFRPTPASNCGYLSPLRYLIGYEYRLNKYIKQQHLHPAKPLVRLSIKGFIRSYWSHSCWLPWGLQIVLMVTCVTRN